MFRIAHVCMCIVAKHSATLGQSHVLKDSWPVALTFQEEVASHSEDHRTVVRLAIESAIRKYVGNQGMCGGGCPLTSELGGTMPICPGCFMVRPSTVRIANTASIGGGAEDVRDSISARSDSVGLQSDRGNRESVGTAAIECGIKVAVDEAGGVSTGNGDGKKNLPGDRRIFIQSETRADSELVKPKKTLVEASEEDVEGEDEAATATADTTTKPPVKCKHDFDEHKTADIGVEHVEQQQEISKMGHDTDSQAGDTPIGSSSAEGLKLESSSPLDKLLLDMNRVASALGAYPTYPGVREEGESTDGLGLTAIVVLDSPLFAENTPGERARMKTASMSLDPPTPNTENQEPIDDPNETNRDCVEDVHVATIHENDREDQSGQSLVQAKDTQTGSKNPGSTASLIDEHPAGLGDPTVALEALLSWVRDGPAPGCQGRREVLLVCGSPDGGDEIDYRENEIRVPLGGESDSRTREDIGKNELEQDRENVPHQSGLEDEAGAFEQAPSGGDKGETTCGRTSWDVSTGEQFAIRQIVLGNGITPTEFRSSRKTTKIIPQTVQTSAQDKVVNGVNVRPSELDLRADNDRFPDRDPVDESPSTKHLNRVLPVVENTRLQSPRRPTQVLLDIQRMSTDNGGPRVVATFPPPRPPPVPLLSRSSNVPPHEPGEIKPQINTGTDFPTKNNRFVPVGTPIQRPRVIVGPVIGRVSSTSAVVLVEVGECSQAPGSAVGVALLDTLSGQRFDITGGVKTGKNSNCPRVFEFEGLTPGRRYVVRLVGVRQRDQVRRRVAN